MYEFIYEGRTEGRKEGRKEAMKQGSEEARKQRSKEARKQRSKEGKKQGTEGRMNIRKEGGHKTLAYTHTHGFHTVAKMSLNDDRSSVFFEALRPPCNPPLPLYFGGRRCVFACSSACENRYCHPEFNHSQGCWLD